MKTSSEAVRAVTVCLGLFIGWMGIPGCGHHEPVGAVGANDELSFFTNTPKDGAVAAEVRRLFSYPIDVVGSERAFRVDYVPFHQFDVHQYVKNQILAVDMSVRDELSGAIPKILAPAAESRLRNKEPFLLRVPNLWATGQNTLFAVAWSQEDLLALFTEADSAQVRREFEDAVVAGLIQTMFGAGEEESIPAQVAREYGWTMRLTPGFFAAKDPEGRFVKFNADDPVRLILVHWLPEAIPLTPAAWDPVIHRVLQRYNDGDFYMPERTQASTSVFQGQPAIRWEGVWQNEKYVIGGPFRAIAFARGEASFLLIGQVFAPGQDKVYALRQVEALMTTFRLVE